MDQHYPLSSIGKRFVIPVHVSFESGEQWTALDLPVLPYRFSIISAKAVVTKAVAGTDNGTMLVKKGSTTLATLTFTASSAINAAISGTVSTNTFEQADQIRLTSAKTTAGGKAIVFLTVEVLPAV
jgi:hypothetical protein